MYEQHQTTPCTSCVFVNRGHLSDSVSLLKETSNVFAVLDNKLSKPLNKAVERENKTLTPIAKPLIMNECVTNF